MGKSLWPCFLAVSLCGISNVSYAEIEVTVYGGTSFRKGLCLEMDNTNSYGYENPYGGGGGYSNPYSQSGHCNSNYSGGGGYQDPFSGGDYMRPQNVGDKKPWIVGGDIIYRIPTVRGLGIGVRYQYMFTSENRNVAFFNLNPKFKAHRIGFLLNYRHVLGRNNGAFIGAILSLDIFRHAIVKLEAGASSFLSGTQQQMQQPGGVSLQVGDYSSNYSSSGAGFNVGTEFEASNWIGTGQAALEAGFKTGGFLIKIEAGYSLYSFHDLETSLYGGGYGQDRFSLQGSEGISVDFESSDPYRQGPGYGGFFPRMKADLSGFYITLGVGFTFEAS